jgi:hypothetical protein
MEVKDERTGWSYQLRVLGESGLYKNGKWVPQRGLKMCKKGPKHGGN